MKRHLLQITKSIFLTVLPLPERICTGLLYHIDIWDWNLGIINTERNIINRTNIVL